MQFLPVQSENIKNGTDPTGSVWFINMGKALKIVANLMIKEFPSFYHHHSLTVGKDLIYTIWSKECHMRRYIRLYHLRQDYTTQKWLFFTFTLASYNLENIVNNIIINRHGWL